MVRAERAECGQEFVVHGPGIIEQGANDALHAFDTGIVQQWAVVIIGEELFLGSIDDFTMLMWQVLQLGWGGVVILDEEVLDVPIHGQLACMFCIVPIQVNSGKLFSRPVSGDIVVCEQCLEEMVCMAFIGVLEAKVINNEDEDQWMPVVAPEAGGDCALVVSVFYDKLH